MDFRPVTFNKIAVVIAAAAIKTIIVFIIFYFKINVDSESLFGFISFSARCKEVLHNPFDR